MIGKWHIGADSEFHPLKRGFDGFYGFLRGGHSYFDPAGTVRGTEPIKEMDYTTDAFGREAEAFIKRHQTQPWFLYLSFNAVHTPMHATPERLSKFSDVIESGRQTYAAMVLAMDEAVGRVLHQLKEQGLTTNKLVMSISDNGGDSMLNTTVNHARNEPLRGSKRTTLEGGFECRLSCHGQDGWRPVSMIVR